MIQTLFGSLEEPPKQSIFDRMKQAASRTRDNLASGHTGLLANGGETACATKGPSPPVPY